ncbi:hypothetical protein PIIN_11162 [Serendipita indica DSM 11827]|uniref:Uncharacterized protein n=1 Tax=Serendipita indica (strain DSM 11827) TaxID=1109443 RepID=G4U0T7_SERID|nr:hypothetical protein PIIN_11162 [Serendipita indica DSM 11827]
MPTWTGKYFI